MSIKSSIVVLVLYGLCALVMCQPGAIHPHSIHKTTDRPIKQQLEVTTMQPVKPGCYWMGESYTPGQIITSGNCSTRWCTLAGHVSVIDKVDCLVPPTGHPLPDDAGCWWQGQAFPLGALIKSGPCAQRWCSPRGVVTVQNYLKCLVPNN